MNTSQRPFSAATSKFAYAQAFAGPTAHRRGAGRGIPFRLTRTFAALRRSRRV